MTRKQVPRDVRAQAEDVPGKSARHVVNLDIDVVARWPLIEEMKNRGLMAHVLEPVEEVRRVLEPEIFSADTLYLGDKSVVKIVS
jgi:hypothetical protein